MDQEKLNISRLNELKYFRERIAKEREDRKKNWDSPLEFGVTYLDDCAGGIYKNDLIMIGAKMGVGKTELATQIALTNSRKGKRVCFFALEAETGEIERRAKYRMLADYFFNSGRAKEKGSEINFNYQDWYYGKLDNQFGHLEPEADELLGETYASMKTFYRSHGDYTIHDFEKQFMAIKSYTDLVVVDHLHYFDLDEGRDENAGMKALVKKCRDLALISGIPVVLVAHLRKSDKYLKDALPGNEDFHGSSDIGKIATKNIILSPAFAVESKEKYYWPTYIQMTKCRVDSSRTRYVGLCKFDTRINGYTKGYSVIKQGADTAMDPIEDQKQIPFWAKNWVYKLPPSEQ